MDRTEIAAVLGSAGLRPQHKFGQNFMVDQNILRAIADSGDIGEEDIVLEVGPGVGNLTRLLAEKAKRGAVLAVDIDKKLMPAAQRWHTSLNNVHWLNADVLAGKHQVEPTVIAKLRELHQLHPNGQLRLVSNLPYNAASPLIAELLIEMWRDAHEQHPLLFATLAFTVQWEVGMRMVAAAGTRDYGPLSVIIQSMSEKVEIVRKIPAGAFWPPPKIASALVVVRPSVGKMRVVGDAVGLQKLLQGVFGHRRQTLGNGLKHFLGDSWDAIKQRVVDAQFDLSCRGEELPVEEFLRLATIVQAGKDH